MFLALQVPFFIFNVNYIMCFTLGVTTEATARTRPRVTSVFLYESV